MKAVVALAALALLAACGKRGELMPKPPPGETPRPVAGPSPTERLEVPTQGQPERADDPLKKSEARRDDRFDLPPQR
jgi:predicted small lipoprotein YifL